MSSSRVSKLNQIWRSTLILIAMAPSVAFAQFSDSYNFLKAVRDRDGQKVTELVNKPGSTIINTRDAGTGETALLIATARRDADWMAFLLSKGANPNLANSHGDSPLLLTTQLRFIEGAQLLLGSGAQVDKTNGSGETPLVRAVHLRDLPMVRFLVSQGANPDKRDLTGNSARDYARQDSRGSTLLEALESGKPDKASSAPIQGPAF